MENRHLHTITFIMHIQYIGYMSIMAKKQYSKLVIIAFIYLYFHHRAHGL